MLPLCGFNIPGSDLLKEPVITCQHIASYRIHASGISCDACAEHVEDVADQLEWPFVIEAIA